ncbi:hypothetical protein EDD15DRAFT_2359236 [Pisolithus albus]|nr:hypothetical protein EDD15DRAFT_2359236 [Pisolithus albus]
MARTRTCQLTGLEESVIPIEAASRTFRIKMKERGKDVTIDLKVKLFQAVLVDIATPPSGGLNLFNLYVALSRSQWQVELLLTS